MTTTTETTITLYEITSHDITCAPISYSLEPLPGNYDPYEAEDDGGEEYILPAGYSVSEDTMGSLNIYQDNDDGWGACELCTTRDGRHPAMITRQGIIRLHRAEV